MNPRVLFIGFLPENTKITPSSIRNKKYADDILAKYDFGEKVFCNFNSYKEHLTQDDPFVVVVTSEFTAQEIKDIKSDCLIYVTSDPGSIFHRKAEIDKRKEEQRKVFEEVEGMVKRLRNSKEGEIKSFRKFAAMSYDDIYKMLIQAIIGDNEDLRNKAWGLLKDNSVHKNFIWMRAQMVCEIWDHGDGKGKEEFLCMAMGQHIDEYMARKLDDFTDDEGQQYHQYMFCDFFGCDLNYIRRIPFGKKGQDKWAYQAVLDKYETPNGPQMMLEAGQMKSKKEEYFKNESEKIARVLRGWKENPTKSKKELGVVPWEPKDNDEDPLTEREIEILKNFLKTHNPTEFDTVFNKGD